MIYEIVLIVLCVLVLKLNITLFLYLRLPGKKRAVPEPILPEEPEDNLLAFRNLFSNQRGETI